MAQALIDNKRKQLDVSFAETIDAALKAGDYARAERLASQYATSVARMTQSGPRA